jgi:hypothetical protein
MSATGLGIGTENEDYVYCRRTLNDEYLADGNQRVVHPAFEVALPGVSIGVMNQSTVTVL